MESRTLVLLVVVALLGRALAAPEPKKIFTECELYNWVAAQGSSFPRTWTCLAYYESRYNSAAKGGPNSNGSYDHGMWQINDNYWCAGDMIYYRHGFSAWSTYGPYCTNAENEAQWGQGC
ncbi:hypothetical protein B566_EDAN007737 [Ephemera danica]|nr:hypothetical protein B566_EDAN007737 [Ephemera danica]